MISVPPTVRVPSSDIACALTWNIGSAVRQRSPSSSHRQWTESSPARRQWACVSITAFGLRVVPEVKMSSARSRLATCGEGGSPGVAARSSKATRPSARPRATISWTSPPAAAIPAVTVSRNAGSVIARRAPENPMMCSSSATVFAVLDGTSVAPSRANANQAIRNSGLFVRWTTTKSFWRTPSASRPRRDPVHALLERRGS